MRRVIPIVLGAVVVTALVAGSVASLLTARPQVSLMDTLASAEVPVSAPGWADTPCDVDADVPAACGWFSPPQQDATGTTNLPVNVLRAADAQASPMASIYLMGGPGGATGLDRESVNHWRTWRTWRNDMGLDHDLVLYDQRGSYHAWPALECPEYLDVILRQFSQSGDNAASQLATWQEYEALIIGCASSVPASDRAAGLYSTATHRDDLLALMQSLRTRFGYRGFVLYGASYGTRIALDTARAAPAGLVERVVLDSFYSPGIDLDARYALTLEEIIRDYDQWCVSEPACDADAGSFGPRLQAAVEGALRAPKTRAVDLGEWDPETGNVDFLVDATAVLGVVVNVLAYGDDVTALPPALDDLAAGRWTPQWDELLQASAFMALDASFSPLAFHLVECRDNPAFDPAGYAQKLSDSPRFAHLLQPIDAAQGVCGRLGVTPKPISTAASDVDALVVSMQIDPVTPWRAAREGLAMLRHAQWRLVRGAGHVVAEHDTCAALAIGAYMNSGALEAWQACDLVDSAHFERGQLHGEGSMPASEPVERSR